MKKPNPHFVSFVTTYMDGDRRRAAVELGLGLAMVGHLMTGHRQPSVKVARRIEDITGCAITRRDVRPDVYGPVVASDAA